MTQPVQVPKEYYRILEELQAVDFVLVELNLFLNTHPRDMNALKQYNRFVQERKKIAAEFESRFGPLQHFGHGYSKYPWQWAEPPWPWQV